MNSIEGYNPVTNEFNRRAESYDRFAYVQRIAAEEVAQIVENFSHLLANPSILELGSGTGFLTEHLVQRFPDHQIYATDISERMIDILREKIGFHRNLETHVLDANTLSGDFSTIGCVVSGFTLQWLSNPAESVHQWLKSIHPNGFAVLSWLGEGSFQEWRNMAAMSGVSYTGNALPGEEIVDRIRCRAELDIIDYRIEHKPLQFDSAISFFKTIRNIGASTEMNPSKENRNLLRLCKHWDENSPQGVSVGHELHYLVLRKSNSNR